VKTRLTKSVGFMGFDR